MTNALRKVTCDIIGFCVCAFVGILGEMHLLFTSINITKNMNKHYLKLPKSIWEWIILQIFVEDDFLTWKMQKHIQRNIVHPVGCRTKWKIYGVMYVSKTLTVGERP